MELAFTGQMSEASTTAKVAERLVCAALPSKHRWCRKVCTTARQLQTYSVCSPPDGDEKKITIVGWSLGGAQAQIAAVEIAKKYQGAAHHIRLDSRLHARVGLRH